MSAEFEGYGSIEERIARLERLAQGNGGYDTGWVDLGTVATYAANWAAFAGGNQYRPMARRFANGVVMLRGLVKKAAALALPETMFTMGPGWRPNDAGFSGAGSTTPYPCAHAGAAYGEIQMSQTGVALLVAGNATWTSLAGISYAVAPN